VAEHALLHGLDELGRDAEQRVVLALHAVVALNVLHLAVLALGDLLLSGPTGTNVNDVVVALVENYEL
jgi:glycerate-2-kinase